MTCNRRIVPVMLTDAIILSVSPILAFWLRFESLIPPGQSHYLNLLIIYLPVIVGVQLISFIAFGLYRRLWQYAGLSEIKALMGAVTAGTTILLALALLWDVNMPRSLYLLNFLLVLGQVGMVRVAIKVQENRRDLKKVNAVPVLIIGAGNVGASIVREIRSHPDSDRMVVGFIDDEPDKLGKILNGVPVIGNRYDIMKEVKLKGVQEIIMAIPSARSAMIREIVEMCRQTKCKVKIVPAIHEVIEDKVTMRQLRDVNIEDLLGRDSVKLDTKLMKKCLEHKRILVTGAGGSIGSELCRQIARTNPGMLIMLGKSENNIFETERELRERYPDLNLVSVIADICNERRIRGVFRSLSPEIVFHAAAHKHVPLMEAQPEEAVRNNIFGTKTIAEAAIAAGVERFVMVSTDKAVNPTSVMGSTKRVAEMVICSLNEKSTTKFAAVRFGNVLGSRGSVVPIFRRQIAQGRPITITHPEMVRYFMTIPEAAQLVLMASCMSEGGEVFVLDMGEPVKIVDLACHLIELTGLKPFEDIEIQYTGLRPGEKLFEEFLSAEEGSTATRQKKIYTANLRRPDPKKLSEGLAVLKDAEDAELIIKTLAKLVPTYQSPRIDCLRVIDGAASKAL